MELFKDRKGFEIGGPSPIFGRDGLLPVYTVAGRVDNCNFSTTTTWEGALTEGANFRFDAAKPPGYQYIRDAVDLHGIESGSMDFVLSSHNIEHVANPIKALNEWLRILKKNGLLALVVPHKEGTFDHLRPVSALNHLIADFENNTGEDDLSHVEEIIKLHDFARDPGINDVTEFRNRSENNFENRCLHQHVFNLKSVVQLVDYLGLEICSAEAVLPMHIICVARKLPGNSKPHNEKFLSDSAECLLKSPFSSDRNQAIR
jgi:SAM-dependent methyltransferase